MGPASKRDDLVTVLLERLDRFESALSAVQQSLARMEAAEEQARVTATEARLRVDDHEARIAALEASKHRAEGAAWAGKALLAGPMGLVPRGFAWCPDLADDAEA
jgi:chromosome segregation ATPase